MQPNALPARNQNKRLADYLLSHKILSDTELHAAMAEQRITNEKLGPILVRNGFLTRKAMFDAVLKACPDRIFGEETFTNRVPAEVLIRLKTMIVAETDHTVYASTAGSERQVTLELKQYYPELAIQFLPYSHEHMERYIRGLLSFTTDNENVLERLMRRALNENVSDVHILPRYASYTVMFRYLGVRHHAHEGTLDEYNRLCARIKDMARMDLAERRVPQDGGFQVENNGRLVDMRVATVPTVNGEAIVIRLLDPDRVQPSLDKLGITNVSEWRAGASRPDGLCLICGPTGSGKTSTLNASVKELDRFGLAVYTAEDPVEYQLPYTGQVNINPAVGLDFSRAIRAYMRADPDVIVLGEIRDTDTARNVVKGAETGHLVFGTLHTSSVQGAARRLRDLDIPANELQYILRTILAQRLVRTVCQVCKGDGCPACFGTGYSGRTVVSECAYFANEKDVARMLSGDVWWPTMLDDAVLKVQSGITDRREVIRVFGKEAEVVLTDLPRGELEIGH